MRTEENILLRDKSIEMSSAVKMPGASAITETNCPEKGGPANPVKSTYGEILKSSLLIGGSSLINIVIGLLRTKAIALFLGPAGFGLFSLFNSIADLTRNIAELGINSSGVRQIAEAAGSGDDERLAQTVIVLRRVSILLGLFGGLILVVFCRPISRISFGSSANATAVAMLSLAVLFRLISDGQGALLQGIRRIRDLAKAGILGALFGTVLTIILIYVFREKGVVPSLIGVAGFSLCVSWWYSRKIKIGLVFLPAHKIVQETKDLLKLGLAFMVSGFLTMGVSYLIRIFIVREIGLDAAGLYQSAWAIGGLYIGFILQAMGADFYPRLTAASNNNSECNRLVNEQAQISLLLAGPGVLGTLTFAPLVITLLYSEKFKPAVEILRWICLGMTLRVVSWPMGFIILAKAQQKLFFLTEVSVAIVHIALAWLFLRVFGLNGVGSAFFGLYCWHTFLTYIIGRHLTGFRWSPANVSITKVIVPFIGVAFISVYVLPLYVATIIGFFLTIVCMIYSLRTLLSLITPTRIPTSVRRVLVWLHFAPESILGA
jgi:antigen flippase